MSASKFLCEDSLVQCMEEVRDICSSANSIRARKNIRTRQPLLNMNIISMDGKFSYFAVMPDNVQIIKDECNVKQITVIDMNEERSFVV